ncbi:DUF6538 domain-containing protein [Ruegeria faecimaris]|uniref:Phage integrase family protein n=1 Tax=Ruegeria faecimaris TaxID=686389 RepID=A0A521FDI1_9RHOB|nr:DUF6538 domain-containing protein [Ruegeria faecimaris]SMO94235.1 Phage integrase family protein [Ruegeria faecimaris]
MAYDKSVPFSFTKNGIYYFERRVPRYLQRHYSSRKISYSLRTRSASVAASRASRAAHQLDEYWYYLRIRDIELPGKNRLRIAANTHSNPSNVPLADTVTLSEAVAVYLKLKGADRPITFHRAAERSCGYLIDVAGDKDLRAYTKKDANSFRDVLIERGLSGSSITRVFGTVRSITNFAASEMGFSLTNPFGGVYFDRQAGVRDREPLPIEAVRMVQQECQRFDDDLRWLVALVSDTGMRLAEVAGLSLDDLVIDGKNPKVVIREHPWRRLKTASSAREVPLVGAALWAAKRIHGVASDKVHAFPRYNRSSQTNANSASAALNKWLRPIVPANCTMHSFRHSMRDRLRAVECPSDIVDQIGGWQTEGVGHSYGRGYSIDVLHKWLTKIEFL